MKIDLSELSVNIDEEYLAHCIKQNMQKRIVAMVEQSSAILCNEQKLKGLIGEALSKALNEQITKSVEGLNITDLVNSRVEFMAKEKLNKLLKQDEIK